MYTIKRNHPKADFVPDKDLPPDQRGKLKPQNYLHIADPYVKPKPKKDPLAKKPQFKSGKKFVPSDGTYLASDEGCFGRYEYIKMSYGDRTFYKDKSLGKEKKAAACHRGAPFGSKNAPRKDEFHQHIRQLQYKDQLRQEEKFDKIFAQRQAEKAGVGAVTAPAKEKAPSPKRITAFDRLNADKVENNFDTNWKTGTKTWVKQSAGIRQLNHGTMKVDSSNYGDFDPKEIQRPKHARVSVTKEFSDISHLS